jgi:hypothetical protein
MWISPAGGCAVEPPSLGQIRLRRLDGASARRNVTAKFKMIKKAKMKVSTLVRRLHLEENGLVCQKLKECATHADSGDPIHDQGHVPQWFDSQ